jgi:YD repeat-containing protein
MKSSNWVGMKMKNFSQYGACARLVLLSVLITLSSNCEAQTQICPSTSPGVQCVNDAGWGGVRTSEFEINGNDYGNDNLSSSDTGHSPQSLATAAISEFNANPQVILDTGAFTQTGACTISISSALCLTNYHISTFVPSDFFSQDQTVGIMMDRLCPTGYSLADSATGDYTMCYRNIEDTYVNPPKRCDINWSTQYPIHPTTGNETYRQGLGIIFHGEELAVTYDSMNALWAENGSAALGGSQALGDFGNYWYSSWSRNLVQLVLSYQSQRGDGKVVTLQSQNGAWVSQGGDPDTLVNNLYYDQSKLLFDQASGSGVFTTYINGETITPVFSVDGSQPNIAPTGGLLIGLTDSFGRAVSFRYVTLPNGVNAIGSVIGTKGEVTQIAYDSNGNLLKITFPDQSSREFIYDSPNAEQTWALTGVVDEIGKRIATITYSPQGWASSSEGASGINHFDIAYQSPPIPILRYIDNGNVLERIHEWAAPTGVVLTSAAGVQAQMSVTTFAGTGANASSIPNQGSPRSTGFSQPPGAGCAAANDSITLDASGIPAQTTDFNGFQTCYANIDGRGIVAQKLEGIPAGMTCPSNMLPQVGSLTQRLTTTRWDPTWNIKSAEAEPKHIETFAYNGLTDPISGGVRVCTPQSAGLPDGRLIVVLCARYEQATTDANGSQGFGAPTTGALRQWSFTYNQYGQVLTATTPTQSANDTLPRTTTYTYYSDTSLSGGVGHTLGDVATVTNPLGQLTTYTSYDADGRLLSSTDPSGTVTTQAYWPRGWLQTQTVTPVSGTALTTSYTYYPTGLLQTVTLPDTTTLSYLYDDAHRLTDVIDGAGNKLHYVLDNLGNRTNEQVSDASGKLASSVTRVFDALNRVQSETGVSQ